MNYIKIILTDTASEGLKGVIVDGFDTLKRYNRGKNLVKVELANFELDPGESLEVGFVQCDESGQTSEAVETVSFAPSLMSTTDDPKVYVAKVPDELFMSDATHYNVEIRRVSYADVDGDGDGDVVEVDTSDSATVGSIPVSARALTREGTEPNVGDFAAIQDKVDALAVLCAPYKIRDALKDMDENGEVSLSDIEPSDGVGVGDFLLYNNATLYRVWDIHDDKVYAPPVFSFENAASVDDVEHLEKRMDNFGAWVTEDRRRIMDIEETTADIETIRSLAKGAQQAFAVNNYQALVGILNNENNEFNIGQNIYIRTLDVPDVWIGAKASIYNEYIYRGDEAFVEALLSTETPLHIGWWLLGALETGKVDLSGLPTREEVTTNLRNGTGRGSIEQPMWLVGDGNPLGAKATGEGAVALGGQRYDKAGKDVADEPQTEAKGTQSFAHGGGVIVEGDWGAGFGKDTRSYQRASHSEGGGTQAGMTYDEWLTANGKTDTTANQEEYKKSYGFAHAEGETTKAKARASHTEGKSTEANADNAHAEGERTQANAKNAHSEGYLTVADGEYAHSEGGGTRASDKGAHAEGTGTIASAPAAHSEGAGGQALAEAAHVEGYEGIAGEKANASHVEGYDTKTLSRYAHSEGTHTIAGIISDDPDDGVAAHSEGNTTTASAAAAHSEGFNTTASALAAHAEGEGTVASAEGAHAQNRFTEATAGSASAAGFHTKAGYMYQFVVGAFNDNKEGNIFEVGGGEKEDVVDEYGNITEKNRKNAFEVNVSGEAYVYGKKLLTEDDSTGSRGGTQLYRHFLSNPTDSNHEHLCIICTRAEAFTSLQELYDYCPNDGFGYSSWEAPNGFVNMYDALTVGLHLVCTEGTPDSVQKLRMWYSQNVSTSLYGTCTLTHGFTDTVTKL